MVNPVQSSRRPEPDRPEGRRDRRARQRSTPQAQLRNLDGSGYLRGNVGHVRVQHRHARRTPPPTRFVYDPHQDQFEQVMGYFWVNQAQEYLQSLGFGSTAPRRS